MAVKIIIGGLFHFSALILLLIPLIWGNGKLRRWILPGKRGMETLVWVVPLMMPAGWLLQNIVIATSGGYDDAVLSNPMADRILQGLKAHWEMLDPSPLNWRGIVGVLLLSVGYSYTAAWIIMRSSATARLWNGVYGALASGCFLFGFFAMCGLGMRVMVRFQDYFSLFFFIGIIQAVLEIRIRLQERRYLGWSTTKPAWGVVLLIVFFPLIDVKAKDYIRPVKYTLDTHLYELYVPYCDAISRKEDPRREEIYGSYCKGWGEFPEREHEKKNGE